MFCFFKKKNDKRITQLNDILKSLKRLYDYDSISQERKDYLKSTIEKYGYLPYPYIKALEELSGAEILYGLEIKWTINNTFNDKIFTIQDNAISPVKRAGFTNGTWITKEQHNIKLINLAGLGNGNVTHEPGHLIDWLRQILILPSGNTQKGVLSTTVYLIPFHPREFGCAYLPTSSEVSQNIEDKVIKKEIGIDGEEQVKLFINFAQLAGHPVIYDVLPQTGRFSKIVLSNPYLARWFDIKKLINNIEDNIDKTAEKLSQEYDTEDINVVKKIYTETLSGGSSDLSDYYQNIYNKFDEELLDLKKTLSTKMLMKEEQNKIHKKVKEIIAKINEIPVNKLSKESDIQHQGQCIQTLIEEGFWPAPGGAWCSADVPIFDKMSECGGFPTFKHFDYQGEDVTHFANLDCQTPYYFAFLESGEFNHPVIDFFINYLKNLQAKYNFDGYRVDHIDHVVDKVSEKNGIPISYRAPKLVLAKVNKIMKEKVPYFATLAEYMLWDRFFKEYHEDMKFDILWGNDIISQAEKNPQRIIEDNQELLNYNSANSKITPLSVIKTYNNQDGEFRAIDQYPGQLGEQGALFKWFKYKFLPGGKNATRPMMFVDGDESFTQTGIESVIGAEVSMPREHNDNFFAKFDAINRFALNSELTREGEAQLITQESNGFTSWIVSKDPLKESILVVANFIPPTQKTIEHYDDGTTQNIIQEGEAVYNQNLELPCDYKVVAEYMYDDFAKGYIETKYENQDNKMFFEKLEPAEFKFYKITK